MEAHRAKTPSFRFANRRLALGLTSGLFVPGSRMHQVYIRTYGCQMNERDSEQVARMFRERGGYAMTANEAEADVILINTCSVRDQAEQKAIGKMGMMGKLRRTKPHVVYGFLGCMAQSRGDELLQTIPHLDLVAGTQKYHRVVEFVDTILRRRIERQMDDERFSIVDVGTEEGSQNTIRDQEVAPRQATAFVSIMQGCNMKCTFCIVPFTRGAERARPIADIVDECRKLAEAGVKEVTLLGQIVNRYAIREFPTVRGKSPFVQLLEAIHDIDGLRRIRFTSPHPIGYRHDLIDAFRHLPKLCSHIHLPLQSGSERVLKAMHRPYSPVRFLEICEQMREARPDLAITTDVIVGFPGETEDDYEATKSLVAYGRFRQRLHLPILKAPRHARRRHAGGESAARAREGGTESGPSRTHQRQRAAANSPPSSAAPSRSSAKGIRKPPPTASSAARRKTKSSFSKAPTTASPARSSPSASPIPRGSRFTGRSEWPPRKETHERDYLRWMTTSRQQRPPDDRSAAAPVTAEGSGLRRGSPLSTRAALCSYGTTAR